MEKGHLYAFILHFIKGFQRWTFVCIRLHHDIHQLGVWTIQLASRLTYGVKSAGAGVKIKSLSSSAQSAGGSQPSRILMVHTNLELLLVSEVKIALQ